MADLGNIAVEYSEGRELPSAYGGALVAALGGAYYLPSSRVYASNGGHASLDGGRGLLYILEGVIAQNEAGRPGEPRQISGETQFDGTPTSAWVVISRNGIPIKIRRATPEFIVNDELIPGLDYEISVFGAGAQRTETWGPSSVAAVTRRALSGSLAACTASVAYSSGLTVTGGWGPVTWDIYGALPSGLSFNTSTGVISGTTAAAGTYGLDIGVTGDLDGHRLWKRVSLVVT